MIDKNVLLDMGAVGLGNLTEYRLLVLLANYHSLSLVEGKTGTPNDIVDSGGRLLYPAYYMTHLKVPFTEFIESFSLWDRYDINVDVRLFGVNILDSEYSFRKNIDGKAFGEPIIMNSNSLFVVDSTLDKSVERSASVPNPNCISKLDSLKKIPTSLKRFKEIREKGFELNSISGKHSLIYQIKVDRDVSFNHGVIFAKFTEIMDICINEYLFSCDGLGLPTKMHPYIHTVDRETYYYANCFADDFVKCNMELSFEKCEKRNITGSNKEITPLWLNATFEMYNKNTNCLLVISKVKKIVCIPNAQMTLAEDLNRLLNKVII